MLKAQSYIMDLIYFSGFQYSASINSTYLEIVVNVGCTFLLEYIFPPNSTITNSSNGILVIKIITWDTYRYYSCLNGIYIPSMSVQLSTSDADDHVGIY